MHCSFTAEDIEHKLDKLSRQLDIAEFYGNEDAVNDCLSQIYYYQSIKTRLEQGDDAALTEWYDRQKKIFDEKFKKLV